jgi:hypothetical protein
VKMRAAGDEEHASRHKSHFTSHTSHVTRQTSHVTRHTSHVKLHTSHVTSHTSHVTRRTFRTNCVSYILNKCIESSSANVLQLLTFLRIQTMSHVKLGTSHVTHHTSLVTLVLHASTAARPAAMVTCRCGGLAFSNLGCRTVGLCRTKPCWHAWDAMR